MKYIITTNGWWGTEKKDVVVKIGDIIKVTYHPMLESNIEGRLILVTENKIQMDISEKFYSKFLYVNIDEILKLEVI